MMWPRSRWLTSLKINVEYKHVRLKFFSTSLGMEMNLSKEDCKLRIQSLADILCCNFLTAQKITAKNKSILALPHYKFLCNVNFTKKYLKLSDLVEFPDILSLNSSLLQHRYFSLKELGFSNISASNILKFPFILKKTSKTLQKEGLSFSCENNFDALTQYLVSSERADVISRLHHMYNNGSSLYKIKEAMNAEFLSVKLGCSISKAHHILHRYPPLRVQSILNTDQLLNILLQKFGFSIEKICNSLTLLSMHHETVNDFLSEIPDILGINTVRIAEKLPLILKCPIDSIRKAEAILKEFKITEFQLMCCPKVIVFNPKVLKERLTTLCDSEDFAMLKSYKKFLWLVYYFNNLNPRLAVIKSMGIPCSISIFTVSKLQFKKYLCIRQCRTHINDICFYLAEVFKVNEKDILRILREYPNYKNSTLQNCRKVVDFLLKSGVTKNQIFNGLGIISYDIDLVKSYFMDLKNHSLCQPFEEWISHYNLIQLLIYTIEVVTGFKGSQINNNTRKSSEQEEKIVNKKNCLQTTL